MIGHQNFPAAYQNYPQFPQPQYQPQSNQRIVLVVQTEDEITRYPVAPGNTVTFIVDGKKRVVEKSLFSQFEEPRIKRYRMVEEDAQGNEQEYATKQDLRSLREEISSIRNMVKQRQPMKKKEDGHE